MATQLRRGTHVGKYRLVRRIGRGAFADVWRARDTVENREVALKVTHEAAVAQWGRKAIEQEARIASRLHHPNILAVRNADWVNGRFIIATDLAETSLDEYGRAWRSGRVALDVIRQVAAGLGYAHRHRVLHRDVKPENIFIYAGGRAALGDFGASRFEAGSRTYTQAGTLGYLAPEQAYGRVRFASDVFSLGLIACELLSGILPTWPFEWPPEGYERFRAKVPEPVRPVIKRAAELDPRRRFADAEELHQALVRSLARAEQAQQERRRSPRRRRRRRAPQSPLSVQAQAFRRAHGAALGMRFACHRCEGPIAEAMRFCPWCGSGENSFRDVSSAPLYCYACEKGVRPEWNFCPWCYEGRFVSNGRVPPPDPQAVRRCGTRGCEGQIRPFMRYCPLCKRRTRRVWSHPDLPDRCSRCRWPTSLAFLHFCPWCARRQWRQ